ncbi:hypothetical protein, partial [Serratia marcescens]|uniref:hypothetical protein n=1 Tax=Serratia marcescens TaxID=615 RepID=UPI00235F2659
DEKPVSSRGLAFSGLAPRTSRGMPSARRATVFHPARRLFAARPPPPSHGDLIRFFRSSVDVLNASHFWGVNFILY